MNVLAKLDAIINKQAEEIRLLRQVTGSQVPSIEEHDDILFAPHDTNAELLAFNKRLKDQPEF